MRFHRLLSLLFAFAVLLGFSSLASAEEEDLSESAMVSVASLALDTSIDRSAFLDASDFANGCTAADCAAFLRNEAPAELVDTVTSHS